MNQVLNKFGNVQRRVGAKLAAIGAGAMSAGAAMAQSSVDVSATTASLGDAKTAVLAIGVAVLAIIVGIKLYKWVKAAL